MQTQGRRRRPAPGPRWKFISKFRAAAAASVPFKATSRARHLAFVVPALIYRWNYKLMERRVNVVAAPTKALLDPSGGAGQELALGKQAVLSGGSLYSRSLLAPVGRDRVARPCHCCRGAFAMCYTCKQRLNYIVGRQ